MIMFWKNNKGFLLDLWTWEEWRQLFHEWSSPKVRSFTLTKLIFSYDLAHECSYSFFHSVNRVMDHVGNSPVESWSLIIPNTVFEASLADFLTFEIRGYPVDLQDDLPVGSPAEMPRWFTYLSLSSSTNSLDFWSLLSRVYKLPNLP